MFMFLAGMACSDFSVVGAQEVYEGDLVTDEFEAGPLALDLVAVVDDSGSMSEELATLAIDTLPAAMQDLLSRDKLEWRIILRIAREGAGGYLGEVTWEDDEPEQAIVDLFSQLTSNGNDLDEAGLGAVGQSITWDNLRPESNAVFWIVSDEHDQSKYVTELSYSMMVAALKFPPYGASTTATLYRDSSDWWCVGAGEVGVGYLEVADRTLSLCEPDSWPDAVSDAADAAEVINVYWTLSQAPLDPFGIEVYVDSEKRTDWTWEGVGNRIKFDEPLLQGQQLLLVYVTAPTDTGN